MLLDKHLKAIKHGQAVIYSLTDKRGGTTDILVLTHKINWERELGKIMANKKTSCIHLHIVIGWFNNQTSYRH